MRVALLLLLSCLLIGCSSGTSSDSSSLSETRVLGGSPVAPATSPQFVQVIIPELDGSLGLCSGTAIGALHILTAAHCVAGAPAPIILRQDGVSVPAAKVSVIPSFREEDSVMALFDDVALIETAVPHGVPTLPLLLPTTAMPVAGETVVLFGFGITREGESGILESGPIALDIVTPNHLIRLYDGEGANSCFGDSGGPLIRFDEVGVPAIVGISSTGSVADCGKGDVSLFINTQSPSVLSFIISTVLDVSFV